MSGLQGAILCRGNPSGFLTSFLDPDFEVFEGCAPAVGEEPSVLEAGTRLWGSWSVLISPLPSSHLHWRLLDSSGEFWTRCCAEFYKAMLIHRKAVPRVTQPERNPVLQVAFHWTSACGGGVWGSQERQVHGLPPRASCGAATPWVHGKRGLVVLRNRRQRVRVLCLPGSCQLQHLGVMKHSLSSFLLTPPPLLMTPFPVCAINLKAPYYSVLSFYKLHIFLVSLLYES